MKEKINEWSFYQRTLVTLNFLESFTTQKNQPTLLIDKPLKKAASPSIYFKFTSQSMNLLMF